MEPRVQYAVEAFEKELKHRRTADQLHGKVTKAVIGMTPIELNQWVEVSSIVLKKHNDLEEYPAEAPKQVVRRDDNDEDVLEKRAQLIANDLGAEFEVFEKHGSPEMFEDDANIFINVAGNRQFLFSFDQMTTRASKLNAAMRKIWKEFNPGKPLPEDYAV